MSRAVVAIALSLGLLVAGCTAPIHDTGRPSGEATTAASGRDTTDTTDTSEGDSTEIETLGGGLPVDPLMVFNRVTALMDADVERPDTIRVITRADLNVSTNASGGGFSLVPPFFALLDVDSDPGEGMNRSESLRLENGATGALGTVTIYTGGNDSRTLHYILAHEFTHYVQFARRRGVMLRKELGRTTDEQFVLRGLIEGVAVFTTNAYIRRYLPGNTTNTDLYFELRERLAPGSFGRYGNSRYIYGVRYVASHIDHPNETASLYRDPPRTSEQLIHGLAPGAEPPRPLSVSGSISGWRLVGTDRLGEGFLRIALQNGVPETRADRAAAGWGNDTLRIYRPDSGGDPGYVWALRFDSPADRTEFLEAFRATLETRGNRSNGTWNLTDPAATADLVSLGADTVVVLAGQERFVENVSVTGRNGRVRLSNDR